MELAASIHAVNSDDCCGDTAYRIGNRHRITREVMGMTNTSYTGDVHSHAGRAHFYRSAEWKALREQVLERDHYECQWCKAEGRVTTGNDMTLEIDHIKTLEERPDLALDPDNLRTLCRDCHNKRHGRFNYKRLGRPKNPYANDERW